MGTPIRLAYVYSGRQLTLLGDAWGVRRRWLGAESDFLFRRRVIMAIMRERPKGSA